VGVFLPKLTDAQKAYLDATDGCRKCRKPFIKHRSNECQDGFATVDLVVPSGWKAGEVTTTPLPDTATTTTTGLRALAISNVEEDDGFWSSGSDDECVDLRLPPLPMRLHGPTMTLDVEALVDTGADASFISDKLVDKLGLQR
jgi:hypothetical protein